MQALTNLALITNRGIQKCGLDAASVPALDFVRRLLRMQLLQCCSQLLAAAAGEARVCLERRPAYAHELRDDAASPETGDQAAEPGFAKWAGQARDVARSNGEVLELTRTLLSSVSLLAAKARHINEAGSAVVPPEQQRALAAYVSELAAALHDSCLLEHAAQALLLNAQLAAEAGQGPAAAAAAGLAGPGPDPSQLLAEAKEEPAEGAPAKAAAQPAQSQDVAGTKPDSPTSLRQWCKWLYCIDAVRCGCVQREETGAATVLLESLSGRCMRYLVLATVTAVLAAADGGPTYGMPTGLLQRLQLRAAPSASSQDDRGPPETGTLPNALVYILFAHMFKPHRSRPASRRAALCLALRIGRLAVASAQTWSGAEHKEPGVPAAAIAQPSPPFAAAGAGAPAGGHRQPASRPQSALSLAFPRDELVPFLINAICAVDRILERSSSDAEWRRTAAVERWRLIVAATAVVGPYADSDELEELGDLLCLKIAEAPAVSEPLPPAPPPDLAAALEGGLLSCLERLVRRAGEAPHGHAAAMLRQLLYCQARTGLDALLAGLLAYGEPRAAAALAASLAKALRRLMPKVLGMAGRDASQDSASATFDTPTMLVLACVCLLNCPYGVGSAHTAAACKGDTAALAAAALTAASAAGSGGDAAAEAHAAAAAATTVAGGAGTAAFRTAVPPAAVKQGSGSGAAALSSATSSADAAMVVAAATGGGAAVSAAAASPASSSASSPAARNNVDAAASAAAARQLAQVQWLVAYEVLPQLSYIVQCRACAHDVPGRGAALALDARYVYGVIKPILRWLGYLPPPSNPPHNADRDPLDALRELLLHEVGAVPFLGAALRLVRRHEATLREQADYTNVLQLLGASLAAVAAACPYELRTAAAAAALAPAERRTDGSPPASTADGAESTAISADGVAPADVLQLSYWPPQLVRRLAADLQARGCARVADSVIAVAELVEGILLRDRRSAAVDITRRLCVGYCMNDAALALREAGCMAFATRPQARGLLGSTCGNPGCANLAGDSEAGRKLQMCGACGAVGYCCRECQTAHWRVGHKTACTGRLK